ncbi:orotidine-5'-phosphate decarboxylase [Sphingomicrobium astaxanthinifaciens]|uniref:orotidine-5'-phosphate decarboxylase n=1 Tax=Sphingomicrobium astaxanthinifaciens TaxID=1227949 RepID=UPI001FCB59D3|nr:orotidine-5'-phosphate decarboxylase [Sphingomicrobium astaxanthinifaciens]MCJ7421862.1 orotidine-5'-phosphate decarboxylase [Sphingomicrobium astaxanthinifaciens]
MISPIFVAIDTPRLDTAQNLAVAVRAHAAGLKLGLEFFNAQGGDGVKRLKERGLPIFLDLKLHDIPNTVGKAVEAIAPLRPRLLTVHAAGGLEMLRAAKAAAPDVTKVVAVTMLTSLDQPDLDRAGIASTPADFVDRMTDLAREAGLDGIVCSGLEVKAMRAKWPDGHLVVPGVRPAGSSPRGDQKRVVTPREAIDDGASVLVIGRPVTAAADPQAAIADIARDL